MSAVTVLASAALAAGCGSRDVERERSEPTLPEPLGTARSAIVTTSLLDVTGDTFVRAGLPNQNEGGNQRLSVQIGSQHRSILYFDTATIRAAVANRQLVSAQVELTIATTGTNWGPGRPIAIHSMRQASSEGRATWSCASDSNVNNTNLDCSGANAWNMSATNASLPFATQATATSQITNGLTGVVSFNVTTDVAAIVSGANAGLGWLVKKVDESQNGTIEFASREMRPAPRLRLQLETNTCSPTAATDIACNGLDDDCDGSVDEDYVPVVTTCGVGACGASGVTSCVNGAVANSCHSGAPGQGDASCDGIDEDCDGEVDEEFAGTETSCGVGACGASGTASCEDGQVTDSCLPGIPASLDATCDGLDDDCDGTPDEDYIAFATSCGVGACGASGMTGCSAGQVTNSCLPGAPAALDATCDGVDDDCNGMADEDYVALATSCGVGACNAAGTTSCAAGQVTDSCHPGVPGALDATCDGIDDDCNGTADEDYVTLFTSCGVGACHAAGTTSCAAGQVADSCHPGAPASADATCDGVDDDCNGTADEDYVALATSCGVGACSATGSTHCEGGSVADSCAPGTPALVDTTCDGADDDCDGSVDEDFAPTCVGTSARSCVDGAFNDVQCGDANACNGAETCSGLGQCQPGTPPELDDADPCTADACNPTLGVQHSLVAAGTACGAYRACDAAGECASLLPPDPADVAPALPTRSVSLLESVRFIFEGPAPIQRGMAATTIQTRSAAVLRGRLLDEASAPLPGAVVRVHGHPEFGQTLTRFDGEYDLVVNGGRPLTLEFAHTGYIAAQRTLDVPWQDYAFVDDLRLLPPDGSSSEFDFPASAPQVHRARTSADARGVRTATLYVPSGTDADLILVDGSSVAMPSLSIRATEFSVGPDGVLASPAELGKTAAFTYSLELSAAEADAVGAQRVELSQAASIYLENFLELPIGSTLPVGAYDRAATLWRGANNGRVVEVIGINAGVVDLDVDGSGNAANPAVLSALGISVEERETLAGLYVPGTALWRAQVQHFAPFDFSFPYSTDSGVGGTAAAAPTSPVVPVSQVLAASLPVSGITSTLRYRSDRVPGYTVGQVLDIPATGGSVSSALLGSLVDIQVAGQQHGFTLGASPGQVVHFTWDGQDGEGRTLQGVRRADIAVGLVFPRHHVEAANFQTAYSHFSPTGKALGSEQDVDIRWQYYQRNVRSFDARELGVGAWSFDKQHRFDPVGRVLYRGDGVAATLGGSDIIERVAGVPGPGADSGDGRAALLARINGIRSLAVGPDGALYIGSRLAIRRVDPVTGSMTTVAGGKELSACNATLENGPALDVCLFPRKLDFGRDGALYISDNPVAGGTVDRIRRLDLGTGLISHVAGATGACTTNGDGGPAIHAGICNLLSHASAPDGSVYVLDRGPTSAVPALRKISPNGIIRTIATGAWSGTDDSADITVGPDGSLYVTQPNFVQRIRPTGEIQRFAGDPSANGSTGEGGLATSARFGADGPLGVTVGPDGRVYVGDNGNGQIRVIDQTGIIRRFAGTTADVVSGDGGSPLLANLGTGVLRTALGPDGTLYLASRQDNTVRAIHPVVPGNFAGEMLVPSDDRTETYRFDANGRHLDTRQTATGTILYSFGYDAAGRLASITNNGQTTLLQHDAQGRPTRILAPAGQETLLETDGNGYLSRVTDANGVATEFGYDANGLLVQRRDSGGAPRAFHYDAQGRLTP